MNKQQVKIIAEVGSNFRNFDDCKNSIQLAKSCGAHIVKFQLFSFKELYGRDPENEVERLIDTHSIKADWLPALKEKADAAGIEFMCSAFSNQGYALVDPFVKVHKVAASENCHMEMVNNIMKYRKPILLSVGGGLLMNEKELLLSYLGKMGEAGNSLHLMYSISSYPAYEFNPQNFLHLREKYDSPGISDHTLDYSLIPNFIVSCLADESEHQTLYYEKHVNLVSVEGTPDSFHSLGMVEFKILCDIINKGFDTSEYVYGREDQTAKLNYARRMVAIADIKNEEITRQNVGFFRPSNPSFNCIVHPVLQQSIFGKQYVGSCKKGDALNPDLVNWNF